MPIEFHAELGTSFLGITTELDNDARHKRDRDYVGLVIEKIQRERRVQNKSKFGLNLESKKCFKFQIVTILL